MVTVSVPYPTSASDGLNSQENIGERSDMFVVITPLDSISSTLLENKLYILYIYIYIYIYIIYIYIYIYILKYKIY